MYVCMHVCICLLVVPYTFCQVQFSRGSQSNNSLTLNLDKFSIHLWQVWLDQLKLIMCKTYSSLHCHFPPASRSSEFLVLSEKTLICINESWQEMETCMVRAYHTSWQPLQHHPSGHLGGWAMLWSAEESLDGQHQRVNIPAHARTTHKGLLQKRLEEDLCWIIPHVPLTT